MGLKLRLCPGDSLDVLPRIAAESVDAVVCDPPYGLEFMGKEWDSFRPSNSRLRTRLDGRTNPANGKSVVTVPEAYVAGVAYQDWCQQWATECLRILKPGGHLVAFGGTRTYHRLVCAIEDAGFEIRDSLHWMYGSGFPKSLDVSKAIDKAAGAEREVVGTHRRHGGGSETSGSMAGPLGTASELPRTAPATEDAARWNGFGTALKPAHEPIVLARKPLTGTVAANVLEYGTGALNVDGCRVGTSDRFGGGARMSSSGETLGLHGEYARGDGWVPGSAAGRWPPNILLTHSADCNGTCIPECPVAMLDLQSGISRSTGGRGEASRATALAGAVYGQYSGSTLGQNAGGLGDTGGASRFFPQFAWSPEYDAPFLYQAKAAKKERPKVEGLPGHPTVKPLSLMRWLARLVTPPGGVVLDPFAGTGTTGQACLHEGLRCILIEKDPDSVERIKERLKSYGDWVCRA